MDQLPSVGPGQVFRDLLQIEDIPKMELTDIYRQGDGSSIIPLAHEIKDGKIAARLSEKSTGSFLYCLSCLSDGGSYQAGRGTGEEKGFTAQDVQVLAPMYRGPAGIDAINKMMQEIFNPNDGRKKKSNGMMSFIGLVIKFCNWSIIQN